MGWSALGVTTSDINHHFVQLDAPEDSYALISENPATNTAVVFVHGFLGDAEGTWLNFQEMIDSYAHKFPKWARSDAFFFTYRSFRDSISDSAEGFLKFVECFFPDPPKSLFNVKASIRHLAPSLISFALNHRVYNQLVLVGHSEGAIVIRRAMCLAYKREGPKHKVLNAQLSLFAPAHLGFVPAGWIGACLAVGQLDAIVMPILRTSPAFSEMKEDALLNQIKEDTTKFLERTPAVPALRARVLFGKNEKVVVRAEYTDDIPEPSEPNQDHVSICKPRPLYERPLQFVLSGIK